MDSSGSSRLAEENSERTLSFDEFFAHWEEKRQEGCRPPKERKKKTPSEKGTMSVKVVEVEVKVGIVSVADGVLRLDVERHTASQWNLLLTRKRLLEKLLKDTRALTKCLMEQSPMFCFFRISVKWRFIWSLLTRSWRLMMTAPQNVRRRKILPQGVVDGKKVQLPIVKKPLSLMRQAKPPSWWVNKYRW